MRDAARRCSRSCMLRWCRVFRRGSYSAAAHEVGYADLRGAAALRLMALCGCFTVTLVVCPARKKPVAVLFLHLRRRLPTVLETEGLQASQPVFKKLGAILLSIPNTYCMTLCALPRSQRHNMSTLSHVSAPPLAFGRLWPRRPHVFVGGRRESRRQHVMMKPRRLLVG